jgi:hemoglobin/transferrin/lactoferrin receptor protein
VQIQKALTLAILGAAATAAAGQDPPGAGQAPRAAEQEPDVIVVTATRTGKNPFELPYSAAILGGDAIRGELQSRTTPETLREVPGISVQKTAHGQGSPKFRGQTGFRTLLLVNGIRINDSTWRSGTVDYWNHLDPYSFDRFEVTRGTDSVLWGSDAVAGVGHAFQKGPDSWEPGLHVHGSTLLRYASAEDSTIVRTETQGNIDDVFGWHLGLSYKDLGDLSAGRDVGLLPETGYDEFDGDLEMTWRLSDRDTLSFGAQQNHLDDVPRTHSTVSSVPWRGITPGSDLSREHDHRRQLYYLRWESHEGRFFDDFTGTVAFKDRYEREDRVRGSGIRQVNVLGVSTLGVTARFTTALGDGTLAFGGDWYHDFVDSEFREFDAGGNLTQTRNRGVVAGNADYDLFGLFAQYTLPVHEQLDLIGGLRWSYARVDAHDVDVPGDSVVFDDVKDDWNAVTANLRAVYAPVDSLRLFGGFAQGFRAPNLSDTTRFDVARSGEQEVPAAALDPEFYYSFEAGGRYDDGILEGNATGWVMIARDQISRFRTGNMVGGLPEVSKGNIGDGYYVGLELEGSVALAGLSDSLEDFTLFGFFDWVSGRIDQVNPAGQEIKDRPKAMPPPTGMLGLRWTDPASGGGAEVFTRMAYHVGPGRYTEADRNNTQRIPPGGLPGYAIFGLRGWAEVIEKVTVSLAIENLTDVDYRIMDSGLNEAGTNVIVTVQARF